MKPLYVAATGQHVGKTTSTLGLVTNIVEHGYNVGYCKPVGQQHLYVEGQMIDKDVTLFSQILGFKIDGSLHSPVVMARGVTQRYIDDPSQFQFRENIIRASVELKGQHEMVVYEGTGHPGVGSVADVSNADVAKLLGANVLMIVEGGIGSTIDKLTMSIAQFQRYEIPIVGVIVNKVIPEKIKDVEYYVGKKLKTLGLDLMGVLPFDKRLSFPMMETVTAAIKGTVLFNNDQLDNRVEDIVAGSLVAINEFNNFKNILLVVSSKRLDEAIEKVKLISSLKNLSKTPISGVIITGDGRHTSGTNVSENFKNYIEEHQIPVIATDLDTYGSVVKISRIEVKINTRTPWKTQRAIELIRENVNVDAILEKLKD
jgi:dethiobiotin synthetase